jgi:hypothetical protein
VCFPPAAGGGVQRSLARVARCVASADAALRTAALAVLAMHYGLVPRPRMAA